MYAKICKLKWNFGQDMAAWNQLHYFPLVIPFRFGDFRFGDPILGPITSQMQESTVYENAIKYSL